MQVRWGRHREADFSCWVTGSHSCGGSTGSFGQVKIGRSCRKLVALLVLITLVTETHRNGPDLRRASL